MFYKIKIKNYAKIELAYYLCLSSTIVIPFLYFPIYWYRANYYLQIFIAIIQCIYTSAFINLLVVTLLRAYRNLKQNSDVYDKIKPKRRGKISSLYLKYLFADINNDFIENLQIPILFFIFAQFPLIQSIPNNFKTLLLTNFLIGSIMIIFYVAILLLDNKYKQKM